MARDSTLSPLFNLPRWSFGLKQLFFWTAAIALGLVALRSVSATWVGCHAGAGTHGASRVDPARHLPARPAARLLDRFHHVRLALFAARVRQLDARPNGADNNNPLRAHNLVTQKLSSATYHWLYDKAFETYNANASGIYGSGSFAGPMGGGAVRLEAPRGAGDSGYGCDPMAYRPVTVWDRQWAAAPVFPPRLLARHPAPTKPTSSTWLTRCGRCCAPPAAAAWRFGSIRRDLVGRTQARAAA